MLVFISWSGIKSRMIAEFLQSWLSQVIQVVEPWISTDIGKGKRWSPEIAERLEKSKVGILCLTKENKDENWILFEAGAISKTKDAKACTLLVDLIPTDIEQPLAQFQHTLATKEDIKKLVQTINSEVKNGGEKELKEKILDKMFETFWPDLENKLNEINSFKDDYKKIQRSDREMIQEVLEIVRGLQNNNSTPQQILSQTRKAYLNFLNYDKFVDQLVSELKKNDNIIIDTSLLKFMLESEKDISTIKKSLGLKSDKKK